MQPSASHKDQTQAYITMTLQVSPNCCLCTAPSGFVLFSLMLGECLSFSSNIEAASKSKRVGFEQCFAFSSPLRGLLWSASKNVSCVSYIRQATVSHFPKVCNNKRREMMIHFISASSMFSLLKQRREISRIPFEVMGIDYVWIT